MGLTMYRVEIVNKKTAERLQTFTGTFEIADLEREALVSVLLFVGARDFHVEVVEAN